MEKKLQIIYRKDYNLLITQDLWQANSQILSIIFLTKFSVNTDTVVKNMKRVQLNIDIATPFLNTETLKMI